MEEEYLDRYRTYNVETLQELYEAIDTYKDIEEDTYDFNKQLFRIAIIYRIDGNIRTNVYTHLLIDDVVEKVQEYGERIEKYQDTEEECFQGFVSIKIKPHNPSYGSGKNLYLTKIIDNTFYQIIFTKTYNKCMTISSIKHEEPASRALTSTELDRHPLVNHSELYDQQERIEKYYNKKIVIIKSFKKLGNYKNSDGYILLFALGTHIGYILFDFPEIEMNKIIPSKKREMQELYAYIQMDCEFDLDKIKDGYISCDPSEIIMKCMIKNKDGFIEKVIVKSSFKMAFNYLSNLANKGLVHVFSVNGSRIEHQFILKTMVKDFKVGDKNEFYKIKNSSSTRIKSLSYGNNLHFFDGYLLLPMGVKDMSKVFNTVCEKGHADWANHPKTIKVWKNEQWEYEFDHGEWYKKHKWDCKNKDDIEYCTNDCEIPYEAMLKYNKIIEPLVDCIKYKLPNGDTWCLSNTSISSIGKQTFLNKYPDIINTNVEKGLFQPLYLGGRCDINYHGFIRSNENNTIVKIDVNSSYPEKASDDLPGKCLKSINSMPKFKSKYKYLLFLTITYKNKYEIPPLGIVKNELLIFPNFTNPTLIGMWDFEYLELKDNIKIHKFHKGYVFETITLKDFIQPWYEIKKNSKNSAERCAIKQLLNGSLGGLGLKHVQNKRALVKNVEDYSKMNNLTEYSFEEAFEGYDWLFYKEFIESKTCYQLIAYVTAKSRMQLWLKFNEIRAIDPKALWLNCDTDALCIYVNNECNKYLKETANNELGGWDFEEYEAGYFRGLKKYCLDEKVVFNGINRDNLNQMSMLHIIDENVETTNEKWRINRSLETVIKDSLIKMTKVYEKGLIIDSKIIPFDI